jgi:eukaryotic-like serine/threonine-protein kinase
MLDREFGKYRLIRRLGRGGMADVYLARDTQEDRDVAIKLVELKDDRDSQDIYEAERRGALLQEQFSQVDDHVPAVHAYGTSDSYFYIDMEYVEGEDLAERIARGPLPAVEAAGVAQELAQFLDKAHTFEATLGEVKVRGIIHGDIKPKNVRLNRQGQVKVLDFGIAKGLALSRKLTRNDFGSLAYLSPERLDRGEVDVHVDFWSIGVLLFEMIAGVLPFRADNNQKLESLIRSRRLPEPLPEACPPPLARIVLKMLAGDVSLRYQGAAEIRDDLAAFRDGRETQADREWLAACESEATRRTTPGSGGSVEPDLDATRRTIGVATPAPGAAEPSGQAVLKKPAAAPARHWPRAYVAALTLVLVVGSGVIGNEACVWSAARQLRVDLATRPGPEIQQVWDRYQGLSRHSLLGFGLLGVRGPLKERLVSQADRVIADYRQDEPAVRETQWRDATVWLANALQIEPTDRGALARLRYCEGHLQRITGEARKRRKLPCAQPLHDAVLGFEEAARLDNHWPDPYLGLARTYVYGLEDLDKAIVAFNEAERRGYRPGNRELVQLADGYRARADRMRREAATLRDHPGERECLQKAADDYRQALDLYRKAVGFGEVSSTMLQVQSRLDEVQERLAEVEGNAFLTWLRQRVGSVIKQ